MSMPEHQVTPTGRYLVWSNYPDHVEAYDNKEAAFGWAYAVNNGDTSSVTAIEGPNGEDLMEEFEVYDKQKYDQEWARRRNQPKAAHRIKALSPSWNRHLTREGDKPYWATVAWVYANQNPEEVAAAYVELLGPDRVKIEECRRV
jgi:hypothetical protein